MISVVPTILARSRKEFDERVAALQPHFVKAHLDVLNDTLVAGESFHAPEHVGASVGSLQFEIHLMTDLKGYDFAVWNQPWVEKIIVHAEAEGDVTGCLKTIHGWGKRAFVALNPESGSHIAEQYQKLVDGFMAMTVVSGQMGSPFLHKVLKKIVELRRAYPDLDIEADGGVKAGTIRDLLDAGATTLAVGSFLDRKHIEERLFELITLVEEFEQRHR